MATFSPLNVGSFAFWDLPFEDRERVFAELRATDPVSWQGPPDSLLVEPEMNTDGFWAITKYEHIREISRKPKIFSNAEGIFLEDLPEPVRVGALSFIVMDAPDHTEVRAIVQNAFSPRHMKTMEDWTREQVIDLIEGIRQNGRADICEEFTKQLPGRIFCSFFNITDPHQVEMTLEGAEEIVSWNDPELTQDNEPIMVFANAAEKLQDVAFALAEDRRENPGEDLMTWVVNAEFEGRKLEDWEIGGFFVLMSGAANDTTRHAMAHAMLAFQENPEQKALLLSDMEKYLDGAVEEVLRWSSVILHMRRQVLEDYDIGGKTLKAGDKLALFYCSGNRDEDIFEDPMTFDITRSPNRHITFGGGGPHFCMGSVLGKQMLKHGIRELYTRMPDIAFGEPEFLASSFMHGVKHLPATWSTDKGI
ncbi:MAG: cytochrome [Solirubrobacterales bacterium]|jgi:cytochrome P450|nr:cytochrome [Solirubrobacterales bacterium]